MQRFRSRKEFLRYSCLAPRPSVEKPLTLLDIGGSSIEEYSPTLRDGPEPCRQTASPWLTSYLDSDLKIPIKRGIYHILIEVSRPVQVEVGGLGRITFQPGHYVYTGSAQRNLRRRLERHLRKAKTLRWHIDYFLRASEIRGILVAEADRKSECLRNRALLRENGAVPAAKGFGSSDCRCPTHLVYFPRKSGRAVRRILLQLTPKGFWLARKENG